MPLLRKLNDSENIQVVAGIPQNLAKWLPLIGKEPAALQFERVIVTAGAVDPSLPWWVVENLEALVDADKVAPGIRVIVSCECLPVAGHPCALVQHLHIKAVKPWVVITLSRTERPENFNYSHKPNFGDEGWPANWKDAQERMAQEWYTLRNALHLASQGVKVFPADPKTFLSQVATGEETCDAGTIRKWWLRWPHGKFGIRLHRGLVTLPGMLEGKPIELDQIFTEDRVPITSLDGSPVYITKEHNLAMVRNTLK